MQEFLLLKPLVIHFVDPIFWRTQSIEVITYYDEISDFEYDTEFKEIRFSMPFEWSHTNINQTSVVHEELDIPKTYGDLLVSGFTMYINGVDLSDDISTIDDFFSDGRVVHFIIYQQELLNIFENGSNENGMNFLITLIEIIHIWVQLLKTDSLEFLHLGNLKIYNLALMQKYYFDVTDVFLKNKPVSTNYDFSITQDNKIIYQQSGISTDSREEHNVAEFFIPEDVTGIVNLNFNNLDNNDLARTTIPIVIDRVISQKIAIPDWIRNNALWWSEEQIDDNTFVQGIEYLIKNEIIVIPTNTTRRFRSQEIPSWIRNNAAWWAAMDKLMIIHLFKDWNILIQKGIIRV